MVPLASVWLLLCLFATTNPSSNGHPTDYEYYEYYYADEEPAANSKTQSAAAAEEIPNYDIGDLVKAWREYIKEKAANDAKNGGSRRPAPQEYVEYECEPRSESYRTPDLKQCDKYYECNIKGEEKELLCPDGLQFEEKSQNCDYPAKVVCGDRKELQTAQPSKNCPRANGFFPWPAEESCQKFWDCRGGASYLQICPEGVIFDSKIDACTTPDQSLRHECRAEKFLDYDCPTYTSDEPLRFGNHDRLSDPKDCQRFFSCLRTGQPRLGVCPRKTVFNPVTGMCDDPTVVPGCETYWTDQEDKEFADYYDY